jgi:hypothetical protein
MNTKSLVWLGVVTLVIAGVAAMTLERREASERGSQETQKLFPDLSRSVNDVAAITIKKKDGEYTLQKNGEKWGLAEKQGYPVDMEPVRKTLIGLTEATIVEAKTTDKERYAKLGVQDPDATAAPAAPAASEGAATPTPHAANGAESSTSTLVTLKDASGKAIASLIVGKPHEGKNFGTNEVYVRRAGEAQSWLAKAALELKDKNVDWLDKKILEVKRDRIRAVDVKHPDGEVVHVEREKPEDTNFTLANIPEGKELTFPTAASGMSSSLEWLNLDDVVPASEVDFKATPPVVCRFSTFDGLTITVTTKEDKDKTYARFEAAYEPPPEVAGPKPEEKKDESADKKDEKKDDKKPEKKSPDEVKKEVADLNARLSPWVYVIPSYNKATFTKHMADLVKDKAPPPPPPGTQPATNPDGTPKTSDPDTYKIPNDLPPEIQKQIQEHQASLGHKTEVVPPTPLKPADANAKPADAKPGDAKPADTKPSDAKPDAKPGDTKPSDAKPGDAKPGDQKPGDAKPDDKPKDAQKPPQR